MEHFTDLRSDLAPLFADEPPLTPVSAHLQAGRRRRTRRRVTAGLASFAVVGVLGAGYGLVTATGTTTTTPEPPIADTSGPPTPEPTVLTEYDDPDGPEDITRLRGFSIDQSDGTVTPEPGATIVDSIVQGMDDGSGAVSVAVRRGEQEDWYRIDWEAGDGQGSAGEIHADAESGTTFAAWAAEQQRLADLPHPDPEAFLKSPFTLDRHGVWTLADGVTLLDQIDDPFDLPAPFTSAALTLEQDGRVVDWVFTPSGGRSMPHTGPGSLQALVEKVRKGGPSMSMSGPGPHLVKSGPDSMPVVVKGVEVLATVENPLGVEAPRQSVAYELRGAGRDWWVLWERGPSGRLIAQTTRVAGDGYPDLASWLADQTERTTW